MPNQDLLLADPVDFRSSRRAIVPINNRDEERNDERQNTKRKAEVEEEIQSTSTPNYHLIYASIILLLVLMMGILLGLLIFEITRNDSNSHSHPSPTPAPQYLLTTQLEFLPEPTQAAITSSTTSPQRKAWDWLEQHPDFNGGNMTTWRKEQLMALGSLYYSTEGDNWDDITNKNWMVNSTHECDWLYVTCGSNKRSTSLKMPNGNPNLQGQLPAEIGLLKALRHLEISHNRGLEDSALPTQLGELTALTHLELVRNDLEGTIPTQLGELSNLNYLSLPFNQFNGPIPTSLGELSELSWLSLNDNKLQGAPPAQLGQLAELYWLALQSNELTGSVPGEFGGLKSLQAIDLTNNRFTAGSWLPIVICMESMLPDLTYVLVDCDEIVCPVTCPNRCGCDSD